MSQLSVTYKRQSIEETPQSCVGGETLLRFYSELFLEHSPADVWSFFSDLAKWRRWSPICRDCRLTGDDPGELQLGSVLAISFAVAGINLTVPARVVQFNPPTSITSQGQKFGVQAIHRYDFIPRNQGTLLCNEEVFTGVGFPLNRLISAWYRTSKLSSESLEGIKRELARGERS